MTKREEYSPKARGERVRNCMERWKKIHKGEKLTQTALASELGIHPVTFNDKLAGRKCFTEMDMRAIARILGFGIEYLLGIDDYMTSEEEFEALIEKRRSCYEARVNALVHLANTRSIKVSLDSSGLVVGPSGGYEDIYRIEKDGSRIFVPYTVLIDWIEDISDFIEVKLNRELKQDGGSENNG